MKDLNLRQLFDAFVAAYPPAQALMREGRLEGELKGAPLRCTLEGARFSRPGLMVIGEAAGSTYDFTGEGIGKAMQTGLLAADALIARRPMTGLPARSTRPDSPRSSRVLPSTPGPTRSMRFPGWPIWSSGVPGAASACAGAWPVCWRRPATPAIC
jgi:hypothetical protein